MNCLVKIKQLYVEFTNSEKKIADIISNEPEVAIGMTSHELAKYSETSPASVVRFARKLGFSSYGEMKITLARNIQASTTFEMETLLKSDDNLELVSRKVVNNIEQTLGETLELIDFKQMEKVVDALREADTIYLYGVGASGIVAQDFQTKLTRINKKCVYYLDYHLGLAAVSHIKPSDVIVAFSHQGQTREVREALKQARANGATCIGITGCLTNPVHHLVDILITLPNTENGVRIGAVQSRYTQLLIVDILYTGLAKEDFAVTEGHLIKTRQLVDELKK